MTDTPARKALIQAMGDYFREESKGEPLANERDEQADEVSEHRRRGSVGVPTFV